MAQLKGWADWRSFRAQHLEIEALCRKPTSTRILTTTAGDLKPQRAHSKALEIHSSFRKEVNETNFFSPSESRVIQFLNSRPPDRYALYSKPARSTCFC